jgi:hypothetical protein
MMLFKDNVPTRRLTRLTPIRKLRGTFGNNAARSRGANQQFPSGKSPPGCKEPFLGESKDPSPLISALPLFAFDFLDPLAREHALKCSIEHSRSDAQESIAQAMDFIHDGITMQPPSPDRHCNQEFGELRQ